MRTRIFNKAGSGFRCRGVVVAAALGALASTASLASEFEARDDLMLLLNAPDIVITASHAKQAGVDETGRQLIAIAQDVTQRRYVRMRATSALGLFINAKTHAVLLAIGRDVRDDREVRIQAIATLAHFPDTARELATFLPSPDLVLADIAKRALRARKDDPVARTMLKEYDDATPERTRTPAPTPK